MNQRKFQELQGPSPLRKFWKSSGIGYVKKALPKFRMACCSCNFERDAMPSRALWILEAAYP